MAKWYEELSVVSIAQAIKVELDSTKSSFVSLGYWLKQARDRELFKETGHKSIYDFAMDQFGLSRSSVSRFMAINDKFSIDGNSPELLQEYKEFSQSQMTEMLTLTSEQIENINPDTTIKQIRELKPKKPKAEPVVEVVEDEQVHGQMVIDDYPEVLLDESIDVLNLPVRTYNSLVRAKVTTMNRLRELAQGNLGAVNHMSEKMAEEIRSAIEKYDAVEQSTVATSQLKSDWKEGIFEEPVDSCEDDPEHFKASDVLILRDDAESKLKQLRESGGFDKPRLKMAINVAAYNLLLDSMKRQGEVK